jgi:DNA repair protein RecO (recombination protein O)
MVEAGKMRCDVEPAFVLHSYPYRETSLVVEAFTRAHGRVALVARGARRPRSALRGGLLLFQPLLLNWSGKSELRTLHKAEWQGGLPQLKGDALLCGFYLNELMMKLMPREAPHEPLFENYQQALRKLATDNRHAIALRQFEKRLLQEIGYALILDHDTETGDPIDPSREYFYLIERGPVRVNGLNGPLKLSGSTLLGMLQDDYSNPITLQESRALMRLLINHHLDGQALYTRQLLNDLREL